MIYIFVLISNIGNVDFFYIFSLSLGMYVHCRNRILVKKGTFRGENFFYTSALIGPVEFTRLSCHRWFHHPPRYFGIIIYEILIPRSSIDSFAIPSCSFEYEKKKYLGKRIIRTKILCIFIAYTRDLSSIELYFQGGGRIPKAFGGGDIKWKERRHEFPLPPKKIKRNLPSLVIFSITNV